MKWDKKIIFMLTLEIDMDTTLPFTFTKLPITDLARVTSNFFLRTKFVKQLDKQKGFPFLFLVGLREHS